MTHTESMKAVETLKAECAKNEVLNSVCHLWAVRKRARSQVTIPALAQRMKAEGYKYEPSDYVPVLKFIAALGLGRLETDPRGRVIAIKDVKNTLQSIGRAAVGEKVTLKGFKLRNKYMKLVTNPPVKPEPQPDIQPAPPEPKPAATGMLKLTVDLNGKPFSFNIPDELTSEDVANLLNKFRKSA